MDNNSGREPWVRRDPTAFNLGSSESRTHPPTALPQWLSNTSPSEGQLIHTGTNCKGPSLTGPLPHPFPFLGYPLHRATEQKAHPAPAALRLNYTDCSRSPSAWNTRAQRHISRPPVFRVQAAVLSSGWLSRGISSHSP